MTNAALRGKPDAGNPHVRFDEGEVASAATPRRGSLLYTIRKMLMMCAVGAFSITASAALEVSDVTARQRWPWNNLVDVDFTLSGTELGAWYQIDVAARFPGISGDEVGAKTLVSEPVVTGDGVHRVTWNLAADCPGLVTTNFSVRVTATPFGDTTPIYMVIDLSAGPEAGVGGYPVRYTTQAPDLSDDTCRTTEMWLRRCPAGTFNMGYDDYASADDGAWKTHPVTLSYPFYIGVFECTQQQYHQVMGTWPSFYSNATYRATRPVESISYRDQVRGNTGWTSNNKNDTNVGSGTFVAKMRTRTGITWLDLPTEAQWEYAARAGTDHVYGWEGVTASTVTSYARGANTPTGVENIGMNSTNGSVSTVAGTAKVGSYTPNNWGLYDMLGNVQEMCGDAHVRSRPTAEGTKSDGTAYTESDWIDPRMDPYAPTSISGGRIMRGGALSHPNAKLTVYNRLPVSSDAKSRANGFRIVVTVK